MNKILYHLPGAFQHFKVYKWLLPLYEQQRYKFYDEAEIYCLYDAPAFFTWTGGRSASTFNEYPHYAKVKKFYESYNVAISLVASNLFVSENDLYNKYCNKVLECYNVPGNSVITANELLHKYIRNNYKNYLLISSTTKCLNAEQTIKEYDNDYDIVVLDYNLNNDWDFLNSLTNEQKSKTEFLMNHACGIKCKNRMAHYINISKSNLTKIFNNPNNNITMCDWQNISFFESMKRPYILTVDRVMNEYHPKGFNHFKIEGRNNSIVNLIYSLTHYLAKPEYREEITYLLFQKLYK